MISRKLLQSLSREERKEREGRGGEGKRRASGRGPRVWLVRRLSSILCSSETDFFPNWRDRFLRDTLMRFRS